MAEKFRRKRRKREKGTHEKERGGRDLPEGGLLTLTYIRLAKIPDYIPHVLIDSDSEECLKRLRDVLGRIDHSLETGDMDDLSLAKLVELMLYDPDRTWLDDINDLNSAKINEAWNSIPILDLMQVVVVSGMISHEKGDEYFMENCFKALGHRAEELRRWVRAGGETAVREFYREHLVPYREEGWRAALRKPQGVSDEDLKRLYSSPDDQTEALYEEIRENKVLLK